MIYDLLMLMITGLGLFGSFGLASIFWRPSGRGGLALLIVFALSFVGFAWLLLGDILRMLGVMDLEIIWTNPLRPMVYRGIVVLGLCAGNFMLRHGRP
jgi:hypothetical protein